MLNITIVGGGNIGTQFSVHCAHAGYNVTIFTSKYQQFQKELSIVNENNDIILTGQIKCATNDPKIAFNDADLIFITVPAFCVADVAKLILIHAKKIPCIILVPGSGGMECSFQDYRGTIAGLQRVPSVARIKIPGHIVSAIGYRKELHLAFLYKNTSLDLCQLMEKIFHIKCQEIPCYLNLTLTPSNPLLHTTRLFTLFKNYKQGVVYNSIPLFYGTWTNEASQLLLRCDAELQKICAAYPELDLQYVKSLKDHYEVKTPHELTQKMHDITGFRNILTPMLPSGNGFIPDFNSRYFTADFPYGLSIIYQIGRLAEVNTPNIYRVLMWYRSLQWNMEEFKYSHYGITTKQDIIMFYSDKKEK